MPGNCSKPGGVFAEQNCQPADDFLFPNGEDHPGKRTMFASQRVTRF